MTETTSPTVVVEDADDGQPVPATAPTPSGDGATAVRRWLVHPAALIVGLVVVGGAIPLAVALARLRHPQWYPVMDQALIELQVRDVGEGHPPLVGLSGRIFGFGQQGSHPGPLMFWSLFPVYWLFGRTAWALQLATTSLNLAAMLTAVWIGYRRGGRVQAAGIALAVVVLARSYGVEKLTLVWNPYVPLLWWVVFLLAVWSLLCGDLVLLPVAVLAGSLCVQTHYPYLGVVGAVGVAGGLAVAAKAVSAARRRSEVLRWRRLACWAVPSIALLTVLWLPPLVEQVTRNPGNLSILREAIAHPDPEGLLLEHPTLADAAEIWLAHLNVGTLLSHTDGSIVAAPDGPALPGLVLLGLWVAAAGAAWRYRLCDPARLHIVVAVALIAGFVSISRITGGTWDYLMLWAWGTTLVLVVATVSTAAAVLARRAPGRWRSRWSPPSSWRPALAMLAVGLVAAAAALTYDATRATYAVAAEQSDVVAHVAPTTVAALRSGEGLPGGGEDARYLVHWGQDARWAGMAGYGFLLALDRHGIEVGVPAPVAAIAGGQHRALDPADADAAIHLVIGTRFIEQWDSTPGAARIAYHEPRSASEIAEYERLEAEVRVILRDSNRPDLVDLLDLAVALAALSDSPPEAQAHLDRMLDLGLPAAVFVAPVDVLPVA